MQLQYFGEEQDKLIVALDFADMESAQDMVDTLGDTVGFYKIGLELLMSGDYFKMVDWLAKREKKVFADLKLYDISATVGKAVKNLAAYDNIHFATIHSASEDIMHRAAENKGHLNLLAVTVLTSLDQKDLVEIGFDPKVSMENLVLKKAKLAQKCGINGVIASGMEARIIREHCGKDLTIATPGIRLEHIHNDDQKRTVDVKTAFLNGVNYIIVGRPITSSAYPLSVAQEFQKHIKHFSDV
jgi:orotidine-5'-phosphate decarboxylase